MNENSKSGAIIASRLIFGGWLCLALSSLCLFLSSRALADGGVTLSAMCLMVARIFGLGAFFAGGVAIFNRWWIHAILLLTGAIGLPMVSLYFYGAL